MFADVPKEVDYRKFFIEFDIIDVFNWMRDIYRQLLFDVAV